MIIKEKIGVIGNGFVGGAVKYGFSPNTGCDAEVRVYDKNPSKSTHTLECPGCVYLALKETSALVNQPCSNI